MTARQDKQQRDDVLTVDGLSVTFATEAGELTAVSDVSFSVPRGSVLAVVGESGCGKSVTAYSILRLIQDPGRIAAGTITFVGRDGRSTDITALPTHSEELYALRGGAISMIFQEPMTALSPVHTVGDQIAEAVLLHDAVDGPEALQRAEAMLTKVGIPGAASRIDQYPFEMSGGMRQRVVIAMALVCNPEILIADEPTTALDVTIQAQIMRLMHSLQTEMGTSILLITHDLGVVAQMADTVAVMYLGRIVERADVRRLMKHPRHPYTMGLLASLPGVNMEKQRLPAITGSVPSLTEVPSGCAFHPRCPHAENGRCDVGQAPCLALVSTGHDVACHRVAEIPPYTVAPAD